MYWAAAQLQPNRAALALHFLGLNGFETYFPRVLERRLTSGRQHVKKPVALFPGYAFVRIELQWHRARFCPGVLRLVLDGDTPAHVPERVIEDIRRKECNGYVVLPKQQLRRGTPMRITTGFFRGQIGLYDGMTASERIALLLAFLGTQRRVTLPAGHVEVAGTP